MGIFFFASRRRHTSLTCDWSSDVCSSDLERSRGISRYFCKSSTKETVRDVSTPLDMTRERKTYASAGVDVDLGNKLKRRIQSLVRQTHGPKVLGKIGGFGGLFRVDFGAMRDPVLVASIDSVGTKVKIAFAMNRHDTVGADLVNHCVNDIAVLGARPLFFLDYIGAERLEPRVFDQLIRGFTRAGKAAGCALIGGETAQMPGMYKRG